MKRFIGVDFGERRIGIAISDLLLITAQPLDTFIVNGELELLMKFDTLVGMHDIDRFIIGLPLHINGTEGEMGAKTRKFGETLSYRYNIPVIFWDERLSSRIVERAMIQGGLNRRHRKRHKDVLSAVVILQSYIDYYKSQG